MRKDYRKIYIIDKCSMCPYCIGGNYPDYLYRCAKTKLLNKQNRRIGYSPQDGISYW